MKICLIFIKNQTNFQAAKALIEKQTHGHADVADKAQDGKGNGYGCKVWYP